MTDANDFLMAEPKYPPYQPRGDPQPMTPLGLEIATRLKEIFYAYDNRDTEDNRSAQKTLGPSEIGTPCDRRLAMSLMRMAPVNPGGDGWAAFVGTQIHRGLADMLMWSDAGTGRHSVEQSLTFPSQHVPSGTTDWIDRTVLLVGDHKAMGSNSLAKLRSDGPSQTYRIQGHAYAYGAVQRGEVIESIAIVAWPREAATLRGLYVHTEPYDEQIAIDALKRVDRIADRIQALQAPAAVAGEQGPTFAEQAAQFPIDPSACTFCPHHLKNSKRLEHGCNGQQ